MLFRGALHRAPIDEPRRVLDIGTGTGIWAIDFAEYVLHLTDRTKTNLVANTLKQRSSVCTTILVKRMAGSD